MFYAEHGHPLRQDENGDDNDNSQHSYFSHENNENTEHNQMDFKKYINNFNSNVYATFADDMKCKSEINDMSDNESSTESYYDGKTKQAKGRSADEDNLNNDDGLPNTCDVECDSN